MPSHVPPYMKKIHVQVKVTADEMDNMDQEFKTSTKTLQYKKNCAVCFTQRYIVIFKGKLTESQDI